MFCFSFVKGLFQKIYLCFLQVPFFIFADRLYPFFCQWHGFMSFKIESYHDRLADTFYFIRFCVDNPLDQVKAFGAYLRDSSLYGDMIGCEYLFDEIRFDVDNDNFRSFPNLLRDILKRSIQSFLSRKRRSKLCC